MADKMAERPFMDCFYALADLDAKWNSNFSEPPPRVAGRPGEPWEPSFKRAFKVSTELND